jgi:glutamine amidotransferase
MENLNRYGLIPVIREIAASGKPFLGICLGLQLLFERSEESPGVAGLGILKGEVLRIPENGDLKIPHMGWNSLHLVNDGRLFRGIPEQSYVYFVHSYYVPLCNDTAAIADYIQPYSAALQKDNFYACQFHPEKSGCVGEQIIKNFLEL